MDEQYTSETKGLQFKRVPIKFYPEDEEKMKGMDIKEQIAFMRKLKAENRYIRLEESSEEILAKDERNEQ